MTQTDLPPALRSRPPRRGETVVHLDYGLCRLGPHRRVELSDGALDTVELRFRGGDTLNVPLSDAVRIWAYGASLPKSGLDPIGSKDWSERQDERMAELGRSLSAILQKRRARLDSPVGAIPVDAALRERAGEGFAHPLTPDQLSALDDVLEEMGAATAMNRIIVGDVGCGKTEVAVRAALIVALSGQAVRFVAPTRVLARQHFETVAPRTEALGLRCALWSGDLTDAQKADAKARFDAGQIDVLVGTHGLLSDGFDASAFALTIIDEEQKFGAKLKAATDGPGRRLRLSATPIPRTLAEARVGLADISLIETYPSGRGATETRSCDGSDSAVRETVDAELSRGGQLIVLCSRIKDLKPVRRRLRALFPDASAATVHGRRKAKRNRAALQDFRTGAVDMLFATSMLETGIDVPSANTMLVFDPHRFGLAQLHQLRGRVGRGQRDARFVLVGDPDKPDSKSFAKRVRALEQMDERGDGLRLALADSLLRGSGRLDDDEQSGHASALGLEIYEYLLGLAAADPQSAMTDLLRAVPRVIAEEVDLFGNEPDVDRVLAECRAALTNPERFLVPKPDRPYPAILSACQSLEAWKIAAHADGFTCALPDGAVMDIAGDVSALVRRALEAKP
ncbi:helicase-related protein [uncultured Algimonas sp.]|uniref:helicase-related protein n=1 Tax=uncultured Algimonas sp. TaxID=1547920 RepID=UPI00263335B2|nr:helicase-related protein [uncultured Algimonas sp.]